MAVLREYDPKRIIVTWLGVNISEEIADGTFVTVARTERKSSLSMGTDGNSTRVISHDHSTTVEMTYRRGSKTSDFLSTQALAEERAEPQYIYGPLTIEDFGGTTIHSESKAFLDGPADDELAKEEGTIVFRFICHDMEMFSGAHNEVVSVTLGGATA